MTAGLAGALAAAVIILGLAAALTIHAVRRARKRPRYRLDDLTDLDRHDIDWPHARDPQQGTKP